jgi:hypothetical protein
MRERKRTLGSSLSVENPAPTPAPASKGVTSETGGEPTTARAQLNYRSALKRAIALQLTRNPGASDLQICRDLDAEGAVELPHRWRKPDGGRLFFDAYMDLTRRHKVEISISKVRADMRRSGLLPHR